MVAGNEIDSSLFHHDAQENIALSLKLLLIATRRESLAILEENGRLTGVFICPTYTRVTCRERSCRRANRSRDCAEGRERGWCRPRGRSVPSRSRRPGSVPRAARTGVVDPPSARSGSTRPCPAREIVSPAPYLSSRMNVQSTPGAHPTVPVSSWPRRTMGRSEGSSGRDLTGMDREPAR